MFTSFFGPKGVKPPCYILLPYAEQPVTATLKVGQKANCTDAKVSAWLYNEAGASKGTLFLSASTAPLYPLRPLLCVTL